MSAPKDAPLASGAGLLASAYQAHREGREADAEALYLQVLQGPPADHGMAAPMLALLYANQGDRLQTAGLSAEAVERYDRSLAQSPRPEAWNNRGVALEALGRLEAALDSFNRAVDLRPDYASAVFNRGGVLGALGRWTQALDDYDRALALTPSPPATYCNNRALALGELNRWEEAAQGFAEAVARDPTYADAYANLSVAQRRRGEVEAALQSAERALALSKNHPEAVVAQGLALAALGRFEEALESYDRALVQRPGYLQALNNAGIALDALDRTADALIRFDAALGLDPGFAEAEFNSALALLRAGRWAEGWRRHEARWRRKGEPGPTYPDATLWLGDAEERGLPGLGLQGRSILLHAEQGLGDTLQFCRYARDVKALGARVILEVQPPLKSLMATLVGVDQIIGVGEPVPPFDRHTPLMSLPLAIGAPPAEGASASSTRPKSLHAAAPYLIADPDRQAVWRTHLPPTRGLRIGLAWSGAVAHGNDRNRSLPAQALAPLIEAACVMGAQTVSVQKEVRPDDLPWLDATPTLLRVEDRLADFADTAALVAICDLVISVDTSVAHLAGALGRPLWLLLPRPCDWRWMSKRDDTPWYPSARLFRQDQPGGWAQVLERAAQALIERHRP